MRRSRCSAVERVTVREGQGGRASVGVAEIGPWPGRCMRVLVALIASAGMATCADDTEEPDAARDAVDGPVDAGDAADGLVEGDGDIDEGAVVVYTEDREPCLDRNPLRNLYWGDLHVHTQRSFDAWAFEVRTEPEQSYRFALGEPVALPPLDEAGRGTETVRLERPLDFVAITDHAEFLAEVQLCTTSDSPVYDTAVCARYRQATADSVTEFGLRLTDPTPERFPFCEAEGVDCLALRDDVWSRVQDEAEAFYDRSEACEITTFVAYEYSASTGISNLHRNVIFRNAVVPPVPVSYFERPDPWGLWQDLRDECLDTDDACDVLAIPHNSNWSNGNLFAIEYPGAADLDDEREMAAFRVSMEPLVEIFQHKGDSECMNGLSGVVGAPDELCDFEKLRRRGIQDCLDGTGFGAMNGVGCVSRYDFVRNVLLAGLREDARLGVNPYRLGIIAATDTHNGVAGFTQEAEYHGHQGNLEDVPERRLGRGILNPGGIIYNPGGMTAVWSVENSRDALFEALRRREVYGTSGPRIALRFFGGWRYPDDLCDSAQLVEEGYRLGVPMGADLPPRPTDVPSDQAPSVVVSALRDPGTERYPGLPLQRIQIVKGWLRADGEIAYEVFDVAGDPDNGATVDLSTCEPEGEGFDSLCAVWTDPDFDPDQRAFYYVRVLENPSCRWSTFQCNALPEADRPETCTADDVPRTIQERAWSSPIWFVPE